MLPVDVAALGVGVGVTVGVAVGVGVGVGVGSGVGVGVAVACFTASSCWRRCGWHWLDGDGGGRACCARVHVVARVGRLELVSACG